MSRGSFAAGKGSALVVDVGHAMASITPVVDGFVLRKGALIVSAHSLILMSRRFGFFSAAKARSCPCTTHVIWPYTDASAH